MDAMISAMNLQITLSLPCRTTLNEKKKKTSQKQMKKKKINEKCTTMS